MKKLLLIILGLSLFQTAVQANTSLPERLSLNPIVTFRTCTAQGYNCRLENVEFLSFNLPFDDTGEGAILIFDKTIYNPNNDELRVIIEAGHGGANYPQVNGSISISLYRDGVLCNPGQITGGPGQMPNLENYAFSGCSFIKSDGSRETISIKF